MKNEKIKKRFEMPDTYVIIFFIVVLAAMMTYVLDTGKFIINYEVTDVNDQVVKVITDLETDSFTVSKDIYTVDATGNNTIILKNDEEIGSLRKNKAKAFEYSEGDTNFKVVQVFGDFVSSGEKKPVKLFEKWGGVGFLNYVYEGFCSGDKWGSAVGVMAFILIIGGAFGIVFKTGAIENGLLHVITKTKGYEMLIIPILFSLFSLGGAVFGMGEETIPFVMILIPVMIALGYDSIVAILVSFVATQIGFAASWMNPFSVAIAQGIAGLQVGSGNGFRIVMWIIFTLFGIGYTMLYAKKIKKNPELSIAYKTDAYFRAELNDEKEEHKPFKLGHALVISILTLGMVWIIWGVNTYEYYLPEIATIFFTVGLLSGIVGVVFKLNSMKTNDIAVSFRKGAGDLLGAAIVVGMAKGIVLVMGDVAAGEFTIMNTMLNSMAQLMDNFSPTVAAWFMYVFQSVFNFFVVSGSGQAALTMPLMAPLADLIGVSKQVAVLAFQLGDGFSNVIVPTCATLMGVLAIARLDWIKWAKFQIKMQVWLFAGATAFIVVAMMIGFN